ncbi:EAL domain-containing protein (putative c-di-GMP-specific phosphodiesterase class I) [Bradyrhizobium elkanii]|nr:EAL domain-containing protein (putative c-di-GMP-specific phosphodiesterase class I) [Bradyrhizobium elkanii]
MIAEGLETEVQAGQLWTMGCKLGQGFAFARGTDRDATPALLRRHAVGTAGATPLLSPSDEMWQSKISTSVCPRDRLC